MLTTRTSQDAKVFIEPTELSKKPSKIITKGRLDLLHKESEDRLRRLNAVVKQWTCSHCKPGAKDVSESEYETDDDDDHVDLSNVAVKALDLPKAAQMNLDNELRLFVMGMNLANRDAREKNQLRAQTVTAKELCDQQKEHTKLLITKINETDELLRAKAKKRIAARKFIREARANAEKCYAGFEIIRQNQESILVEYDNYLIRIQTEIARLKNYKQEIFPRDRRKIQSLMETQRIVEDVFYRLHKREMQEMRHQMQVIKSDLSRYENEDRKKMIQRLTFQVRNLRLEPLTYERDLIKSDNVILEQRIKNLKEDVAFMQDYYVKLIYSEDVYASATHIQ